MRTRKARSIAEGIDVATSPQPFDVGKPLHAHHLRSREHGAAIRAAPEQLPTDASGPRGPSCCVSPRHGMRISINQLVPCMLEEEAAVQTIGEHNWRIDAVRKHPKGVHHPEGCC